MIGCAWVFNIRDSPNCTRICPREKKRYTDKYATIIIRILITPIRSANTLKVEAGSCRQ